MQKDKKNEIISEGVDAASSVLSVCNPIFATVPLIKFAIKRVAGLMNSKDIIQRMKRLEREYECKKIDSDEFKEKIYNLCEHDRYVVSNNLNKILIDCIPETVDIYIRIFIEMIMHENQRSQYEELCEIISQLNANDLNTLQMIKEYTLNGNRNLYKKTITKKNSQTVEMANGPFIDRNMLLCNKTIFWEDFMKSNQLNVTEMVIPLLMSGTDENGEKNTDWSYIIRSLIKLENLGVLVLDFKTTFGNSSRLNADRFHMSLFGEKLLEYINVE